VRSWIGMSSDFILLMANGNFGKIFCQWAGWHTIFYKKCLYYKYFTVFNTKYQTKINLYLSLLYVWNRYFE
jgi:hypothetical protein